MWKCSKCKIEITDEFLTKRGKWKPLAKSDYDEIPVCGKCNKVMTWMALDE